MVSEGVCSYGTGNLPCVIHRHAVLYEIPFRLAHSLTFIGITGGHYATVVDKCPRTRYLFTTLTLLTCGIVWQT